MTKEDQDVSRLISRLKYLYDDYCKELKYSKYYGSRLSTFRRLNFWMEIIIAAGTSSVVASLIVFGTLPGRYIWLLISGVSAVMVTAKPVFHLGEKIENYVLLHAGYSDAYFELQYIVRQINNSRSFTAILEERYKIAQDAVTKLRHLVEPKEKKALMRRSENEAKEEISHESLWLPEAPSSLLRPLTGKPSRLTPSMPLQGT